MTEQYGIVLKRIMRDPSISVESKAIYAYLASFADINDGKCYPTVSLICKELNMSENRFHRHLKQLKDKGYVVVSRTRKGTKFDRNIYKLPCLQNKGTESFVSHASDLSCTQFECMEIDDTNNTSSNNTRKPNNTTSNTNMWQNEVLRNLNAAKQKAGSKGRLKSSSFYLLDRIVGCGISMDAILSYSKEVAAQGKDTDWFTFKDYCMERSKK